MREAVIVSYARTGLAKSGRGGFNITPPMSMAAHAIKHAVARAGVEKDYVEDCYLGNCAHGAPNIGRQAALLAGMPKSTAGVSVNRFCSSGLQTIAMADASIRSDGADCIVAGGVESISIPGGGSPKESIDPDLLKAAPDIFMAMIDTADIVAERYKLSREYQDEYSLESQRRMAAAQQANKFKDEIVPMKTKMKVVDKATKAESIVDYTVDRDGPSLRHDRCASHRPHPAGRPPAQGQVGRRHDVHRRRPGRRRPVRDLQLILIPYACSATSNRRAARKRKWPPRGAILHLRCRPQ